VFNFPLNKKYYVTPSRVFCGLFEWEKCLMC